MRVTPLPPSGRPRAAGAATETPPKPAAERSLVERLTAKPPRGIGKQGHRVGNQLGSTGRTSGLMAAVAARHGIDHPEPQQPGYKPSRIVMNQIQYLTVPRKLAGARHAAAAANTARLESELAAQFGDHAQRVASFGVDVPACD